MKLTIKVALLFLILFVIPFSLANTDYNETGNYDSYFRQGTGFFNTELVGIDTATRSINTQRQTPLVSDLDGDGTNEIIILDDSVFRLYHDKELAIIDSYNLPTSERYSNFITFDIDADGYREIIIILEQSEQLHILEYNGTTFHNQTNISLIGLTHDDGEFLIKCESAERCLMVYSEDIDNAPANSDFLRMAYFNSTGVFYETSISTSSEADSVFCFPRIRTMAVANYDSHTDTDVEFIFSVADLTPTGEDEIVEVHWVNILSNNSPVIEQSKSETRVGSVIGMDGGCIDYVGDLPINMFTPPVVFDIDGSSSNGLETVIGTMLDPNEFKMFSYKSDATNLDDYPEVAHADGILISNVIQMNAFTDTGTVDFCVLGFQRQIQEIDLLCASEQTGEIPETNEFDFDISGLYNVTEAYGNWNIINHAGQHSTLTTDDVNLNEIINTYGVFSLDKSSASCKLIGTCDLTLIYENPQTDAVVIPVDAEQVGREDLIVLTSTNLWYLDDRFSNSAGSISYYYINPCLDATWKVNTSAEIRITVEDVDNDLVSARAILYYGDDNEQDLGWSVNQSSGTTFSFGGFKANTTIGVGTIRLLGRDTGNPSENDTIDLTFSVASQGVEFGDCTTEVDIVPEVEVEVEVEADLTTDATDNALVNSVNAIIALTGMGGTTLWLFGLLVLTLFIWFEMAQRGMSGNSAVGAIAIFNILGIILGARIGIFSTGMIITMVVIGIVVIGVFLGKFLMGKETAQ